MTLQPSIKLSPLQLELLKVYAFCPTEEELLSVKQMLAHFFAHRFTQKIADAADLNQISNEDLDNWLESNEQ
jgi:hypothetical protein